MQGLVWIWVLLFLNPLDDALASSIDAQVSFSLTSDASSAFSKRTSSKTLPQNGQTTSTSVGVASKNIIPTNTQEEKLQSFTIAEKPLGAHSPIITIGHATSVTSHATCVTSHITSVAAHETRTCYASVTTTSVITRSTSVTDQSISLTSVTKDSTNSSHSISYVTTVTGHDISVKSSPKTSTVITPAVTSSAGFQQSSIVFHHLVTSSPEVQVFRPTSHAYVTQTPVITRLPVTSTASPHEEAPTFSTVPPVPETVSKSPSTISQVTKPSVTVKPTTKPVTDWPPYIPEAEITAFPQRVMVGSDVELKCTAKGSSSAPQITWIRKNEQVTSGYSTKGHVSTLELKNVTREVGGAYLCEVRIPEFGRLVFKAWHMLRVHLPVMPAYPVPDMIDRTATTMTVPLHHVTYLSNGERVEFIQIVVASTTEATVSGLLAPDSYTPEDLAVETETSPYIAAMFSIRERWEEEFIVGDSKNYPHLISRRRRAAGKMYHNAPLKPDSYYTIFQRLLADNGAYESLSWMPPVRTRPARPTVMPVTHEGGNNIALIMGILVGLLLVVLLGLLVGKVYLVRKNQQAMACADTERYEMAAGGKNRLEKIARTFTLAGMKAHYRPCGSISIDDFEQHVARMRRSGDLFFTTEYERIPVPEHVTATHSLDPVNQHKNRYINIVAYDHSRVKLQDFEDEPGSDYINANFLPGYRRDNAYIAAQGPLAETCRDFWRMVWEQNSRTIIMLTNLKERCRDKCAQYWPSRGSLSYEDITVTLDSVTELTPYIVRTLSVQREGCDDVRQVKQFHFTSWPDHGVPTSVCNLLAFVRDSTRADPPGAGPMVVHCSAGVGRTGTFIVIDVMLQQIHEEKTVDILGFVSTLRRHRNLMVQTEQQYIFIHDALLDAIISGETETSASDLRSHIRRLQEQDPESGYTPMFTEFQKLSRCINSSLSLNAATHPVNKRKNRYANVLPYDVTRVRLSMQVGVEGSDYINANYIDGYMAKRTFIATQAPIPETIPDFWRMVWEQNCCTIVTLAQEVEQAKAKMHRYWPGKQPITFGSLVVEMQDKVKSGHLVVRIFKLTNTEVSASRDVRQFHYTSWTEENPLEDGLSRCQLIDLIGQVQYWQAESGRHPIIVHCSAGVGRTGVFCAVSILIERLKAEAMVDVFQTVKQLREQRPAMVQTKGQYDFCYQVVLEYLASFEPPEASSEGPNTSYPFPDSIPPFVTQPQDTRQSKRPSKSDLYEETTIASSDTSPKHSEFKIKNSSPQSSPAHSVPIEPGEESGPLLAGQEDLSDDSSDYEETPIFGDSSEA